MAGSEPAKKVRLNRANEADERLLVEAAQRDASRFAALYESNLKSCMHMLLGACAIARQRKT